MSGKLEQAAQRVREFADGPIEIAVVAGSGLGDALLGRFAAAHIPYEELPGAPARLAFGHLGEALVGEWRGRRVAVFAGRAHLYQGYSAAKVTYFVRLAAESGAASIVLTNAAGALNETYRAGDLMVIADHLNYTGTTPIDDDAPQPFVDMTDAYAPHLRALARRSAPEFVLHHGVYAGVRGPQYETAAERRALRLLGADAVGMSTVLETIAARSLGLSVLGISAITNVASDSATTHEAVVRVARDAGERLAVILDRVVPHI